MTATRSTEARPRSLALLVAAGTLAIVVVILVLVFGVARPPSLAALADDPDPAPSASVAWIEHDGGDPCLHVADPDGTRTELRCDHDVGEPIAWDADGIHVRSWDVWDEVRVFDAETGEDVAQRTIGDPDVRDIHADTDVVTRTRDGTLTVSIRTTGQVVWETEVHDTYHVRTAVRSPDGDWVALLDSADRLVVVPSDGAEEPRVWAEGVTTWDGLVWEGTEPRDLAP